MRSHILMINNILIWNLVFSFSLIKTEKKYLVTSYFTRYFLDKVKLHILVLKRLNKICIFLHLNSKNFQQQNSNVKAASFVVFLHTGVAMARKTAPTVQTKPSAVLTLAPSGSSNVPRNCAYIVLGCVMVISIVRTVQMKRIARTWHRPPPTRVCLLTRTALVTTGCLNVEITNVSLTGGNVTMLMTAAMVLMK